MIAIGLEFLDKFSILVVEEPTMFILIGLILAAIGYKTKQDRVYYVCAGLASGFFYLWGVIVFFAGQTRGLTGLQGLFMLVLGWAFTVAIARAGYKAPARSLT